jgi:hypothetical protein
LEQCERGLAGAYRQVHAAGRANGIASRLAREHDEHACLLRARIVALGGEPAPDADESWLDYSNRAALTVAEERSFACYRDQLITLDPASARIVRSCVLPHPYRAGAELSTAATGRSARPWRPFTPPLDGDLGDNDANRGGKDKAWRTIRSATEPLLPRCSRPSCSRSPY